eukprot:gene4837-6780_t
MGPYIKSTKENITGFVETLSRIYANLPLRIAFIGYRDHGDLEHRLAVLPFTTDLKAFREFVAKQPATGGGDGPEDVFGALNVAAALEWRSSTRILYHIGDAPCHGNDYHDEQHDDYPLGDPNGLQADDILQRLKTKNIVYFFGKISSQTDKMILKFNELVGSEYVQTTPLTADSMMTVTARSVGLHLSSSMSSSSRISIGSVADESKDLVLFDGPIDWPSIPIEEALRFKMKKCNAICDANEQFEIAAVIENFPEKDHILMKCGTLPFAKGGSRAAYWAIKTTPYGEKLSVVKRNLSLHLSRNKSLLGEFEKYNNNNGVCTVNPTRSGTDHQIIQTFSHWTHIKSEGKLIVVDCQGIFRAEDNEFSLTDPAIHHYDLTGFAETNLGAKGMEKFFATHKCNGICREMNLGWRK